MHKMKNILTYKFYLILIFSIFTFYPGIGFIAAGRAFAQNDVNTDYMLNQMPDAMPKNYTDEEINQMLEDVQKVDDSSDNEGIVDSEPPVVSDTDSALVEDIKNNPEKYAEYFRDMDWLDAHPWVVWSLCSDYAWIDAHPYIGARIYVNFGFWYRYPKIAYIIACNRPFLVRYPRITLVIYQHDDWFIQHPFIAREIYRNYVIFNRYTDLYNRYYRHQTWIQRHPGIVRIAYGNRALFKSHPQYLGTIYTYRRNAVRQHIIRQPHLKIMYERMRNNPSRYAHDKNRRQDKDWNRSKDRERANDQNRANNQKSGRNQKRVNDRRPGDNHTMEKNNGVNDRRDSRRN